MLRYRVRFKLRDHPADPADMPLDEHGWMDLGDIGPIEVEGPQQLGALLRAIDSRGHLVLTSWIDESGEEQELDKDQRAMVERGMFPRGSDGDEEAS